MTEKAPAELVRRGRGDAVSAKGDRSDGLALLGGDHHGSAGCHDRHQAVYHHAGIGGLGAFGLGGSGGLLGGQGDGDAALGLGILLTHHALELGGDVVHQHLVQRQTGVELAGGGSEGIVGVAAGGQEVVGDHGIGLVGIKGLTVDAVDGDAVDGSGTMVGGAGIGVGIGVILLGGVNGDVHAGDLGEAAQGLGQSKGRSLQGLQQLGAGDVHHGHGVAEGQHGVHVQLGDVALVDGSADAAAVGDGHHVLGGNGELSVLADGPQHGVGDQVAQVGLLGAVAGILGAVELHVGSGKNLAVLGVDVADDLVGGSLHGGVLLGEGGQVDEAVALDALGGVVNDDGAHIGKARAGGLDHAVVLAGGHHRVGVAVDEQVDALDVLHHIIGAVGLGGVVHAQVAQGDDDVGIPLVAGHVHVLLGDLVQILAADEVQALHQGGVGLGLALGGGNAYNGDAEQFGLVAVVGIDGSGAAGGEDQIALIVHQVVAGDHEIALVLFQVLHQLGEAIVKLVVAQGDDVIAHQGHHVQGGCALAEADVGRALAVVTGVQQDHLVSALVVALVPQSSHLGVLVDSAVDVVGVQDDGLALQGVRELIRLLVLAPGSRDHQRQRHDQRQQSR